MHPYQFVDLQGARGGNRGHVMLQSPEINRGPLIMEKRVRQRGLGEGRESWEGGFFYNKIRGECVKETGRNAMIYVKENSTLNAAQ